MMDNSESHNTSSENDNTTLCDSINSVKIMYGKQFNEHLLEEYKIFVNLAEQTSVRRVQASKFYISVLSALFTFLSLIIETQFVSFSQTILTFSISILGLAICLAWYLNIQSYKQLNSLRFKVLQEMEQQLPFRCFTREWEILKSQSRKKNNYIRLTTVECFIPIIFAIPYVVLTIYASLKLLNTL